MKLDDWNVSEDDERVGFVQLLAAFLTFSLLLVAILGVVVVTWAGLQP